MLCKDWSYAATSQGTPKIVSKPLEATQEAWNRSSLTALRGTNTADTLILDY